MVQKSLKGLAGSHSDWATGRSRWGFQDRMQKEHIYPPRKQHPPQSLCPIPRLKLLHSIRFLSLFPTPQRPFSLMIRLSRGEKVCFWNRLRSHISLALLTASSCSAAGVRLCLRVLMKPQEEESHRLFFCLDGSLTCDTENWPSAIVILEHHFHWFLPPTTHLVSLT